MCDSYSADGARQQSLEPCSRPRQDGTPTSSSALLPLMVCSFLHLAPIRGMRRLRTSSMGRASARQCAAAVVCVRAVGAFILGSDLELPSGSGKWTRPRDPRRWWRAGMLIFLVSVAALAVPSNARCANYHRRLSPPDPGSRNSDLQSEGLTPRECCGPCLTTSSGGVDDSRCRPLGVLVFTRVVLTSRLLPGALAGRLAARRLSSLLDGKGAGSCHGKAVALQWPGPLGKRLRPPWGSQVWRRCVGPARIGVAAKILAGSTKYRRSPSREMPISG